MRRKLKIKSGVIGQQFQQKPMPNSITLISQIVEIGIKCLKPNK